MTDAGVDAVFALTKGESKRWAPGCAFKFDLEALYMVGSAPSQLCYVTIILADGRRIPIQRT